MKFKTEISAGGIVFKKEKKQTLWLTTKHSGYKKWTFPKGLIADNIKDEGIEQAALREVEEEGGIKAKIVDEKPVAVRYKYRLDDYLVDKTVYYFLMEYISGDIKDHDWEVEDAKFVNEEEIKTMLSFNSDKQAFEEILEKFKKK